MSPAAPAAAPPADVVCALPADTEPFLAALAAGDVGVLAQGRDSFRNAAATRGPKPTPAATYGIAPFHAVNDGVTGHAQALRRCYCITVIECCVFSHMNAVLIGPSGSRVPSPGSVFFFFLALPPSDTADASALTPAAAAGCTGLLTALLPPADVLSSSLQGGHVSPADEGLGPASSSKAAVHRHTAAAARASAAGARLTCWTAVP